MIYAITGEFIMIYGPLGIEERGCGHEKFLIVFIFVSERCNVRHIK